MRAPGACRAPGDPRQSGGSSAARAAVVARGTPGDPRDFHQNVWGRCGRMTCVSVCRDGCVGPPLPGQVTVMGGAGSDENPRQRSSKSIWHASKVFNAPLPSRGLTGNGSNLIGVVIRLPASAKLGPSSTLKNAGGPVPTFSRATDLPPLSIQTKSWAEG